MTRLIYCYPSVFNDPAVRTHPGVVRFSLATKLYGYWVMPLDRTGVITTPIRNISLFPMPKFRSFSKSYEDICNDRAVQILGNAEKLGIGINVLYSGGIDSTCLLVSLLKQATPEQKKRITVLLSHESIAENPRFYDEHIKGRLRMESSVSFANYIGQNDMLLSAEHNDLVMGNASVSSMITQYGPAVVHQPYSRSMLVDFFGGMLGGDAETANFYFDLFERLAKTAPMPIRTNFDFVWWYNFATKWQACFSYILFFTPVRNAPNVTKEYIDTRFISFYNTDEFQLWSMNNLDKRIRDTWKSYKWVLKDIIYDYTKDAEYRDNKTKVRSLPIVLKQQDMPHRFLDEHMRFSNNLASETYLEPANDFV